MSTRRNAHTITITIADLGDGRPAAVAVTGPSGQWSAALSLKDGRNFVGSIVDVVSGELGRVLCSDPDAWPGEGSD